VPVERRPVLGEQRTAVSELYLDAAGELTALSNAAYPLTAAGAGDPTGAQVAAELADPDVISLGVREPAPGRQLVAAASVRVDLNQPGVADVARLVVEPGRGRRGLGGLLLRAAEHRLPPQVRQLWLQVCPTDENSLRFYARHGYRKAHRDHHPSGTTVHLLKTRGRRGRQGQHLSG